MAAGCTGGPSPTGEPAEDTIRIGGTEAAAPAEATPTAAATPRQSRGASTPPKDEPVEIMLIVGDLKDTDGNGFNDSLTAVVYLFSRSTAEPIWAEGAFSFAAVLPNGEVLADWYITPDQAAGLKQRLNPGPAYVFGLVLAEDADEFPRTEVNVFASFTTLSGREVRSRGPVTVMLGTNMR